MAQFKQWALEYVLADDEPVQLEIAKKAANGEHDLPAMLPATAQTDRQTYTDPPQKSRARAPAAPSWAAGLPRSSNG
jgi:hypothetical protein